MCTRNILSFSKLLEVRLLFMQPRWTPHLGLLRPVEPNIESTTPNTMELKSAWTNNSLNIKNSEFLAGKVLQHRQEGFTCRSWPPPVDHGFQSLVPNVQALPAHIIKPRSQRTQNPRRLLAKGPMKTALKQNMRGSETSTGGLMKE